ncbi:MAG: HEAT repeat domain-containing protein [Gammaproteobacteria bacterium]|nr:HEAT repeat domain-containing protein [Sideroxydans sp.]MBU4046367.1 HEAT repeat domain-containing protein [Gammaproteobacteria bacterium]
MTNYPPDALLFVTPDCPHCATVKHALQTLQQEGQVADVRVVDASAQPELARQYEVRSAPWLKLGIFTLTGAHTLGELRQWVDWAHGEEGKAHYVAHLLTQGGYVQASAFIHADTQRLKPLLSIVADPSANLEVRLGVSALLESYGYSPALQALLPELAELSCHADHRVRADACHLLGLTGSVAAKPYVEACLHDANEEVREIAVDAMHNLKQKRVVA